MVNGELRPAAKRKPRRSRDGAKFVEGPGSPCYPRRFYPTAFAAGKLFALWAMLEELASTLPAAWSLSPYQPQIGSMTTSRSRTSMVAESAHVIHLGGRCRVTGTDRSLESAV